MIKNSMARDMGAYCSLCREIYEPCSEWNDWFYYHQQRQCMMIVIQQLILFEKRND